MSRYLLATFIILKAFPQKVNTFFEKNIVFLIFIITFLYKCNLDILASFILLDYRYPRPYSINKRISLSINHFPSLVETCKAQKNHPGCEGDEASDVLHQEKTHRWFIYELIIETEGRPVSSAYRPSFCSFSCQPFITQHAVYNMVDIPVIQPFGASDPPFLFIAEPLRYGPTFLVPYSRTDFYFM